MQTLLDSMEGTLTTLQALQNLQSKISLSTLEGEYSALSSSMHTLLPLRSKLIKIMIEGIKLPHIFESTVKCQIFEDNNGALLLATIQRIPNHTSTFRSNGTSYGPMFVTEQSKL
jgi:hypothetical protein